MKVIALALLCMLAVAYAHDIEPTEKPEEKKEEGCGCEKEEKCPCKEEEPKCEPEPEPHYKLDWHLVHFEEYSKGAKGWTNNEVSECDCRKILGGYNKFAGGEVHKTIEELPEHTHLRVKANYYFIDDWNKEAAFAKVDDKLVWASKSHDKSWKGINVCGDAKHADFINQIMDVVVPHEDSCVKLTFGSNLDEDASNESWGIANVGVYLGVHDAPKPKCSKE